MSTTPAVAPEQGRPKILTRPILEWALWDWGSAAFNAVATTFVFSVYLTGTDRFAPGDEASVHLTTGMTVAGILIAVLAPITGQRADRRGKGGVWLGWFTGMVVLCCAAMFFVAPDSPLGRSGAMWLGIGLLGLGNVFFEFASVNYNAMLNHLTTKENMGRVSGLGWGAGYVGGIVLLLILYIGLIGPNLFGVPTDNGLTVRVSMVIAAAWFALSAAPVVLRPPKPAVVHTGSDEHESLLDSYRLLWGTVKSLYRDAPQTLFFLIASAVFRDGLAGVFTFGAILAGTAFGFSSGDVLIFAIAANVVAGLATVGFGALDDRFGPKKVIIVSLVAMVASGMGVFLLHDRGPVVFWSLGLVLCVFVGPTQSASRSFLGRMIPKGREGEVYGLYATTGRAVSFLAPAMYGLFLRIGESVTPAGQDFTYWGILGIILILLAGLLLTLPVKAHRAHLDHLGE
ncbi:MFS transporter [Actinomyces sp. B33]|uniref:MFS transporter n=1 Tax=Actinomyces sp. B33 TaxID=2942131 RepID=UPI0023420CB2|nr:MFS transporter [Actinomyces sp. B33]MDC4232372.1 MFS transporter [Actinomyces sp. B33]